ncbi:MAG: HD domain-containing protein [Planctomycetota bacterium]|nr:HD domain-containing protein [Planctomycetota bacterium]MDW8372232.1 HD domain-containing protein [Planctomycetota bacterium]
MLDLAAAPPPWQPPLYEIRDPIHGTILIDEAERRVVDHPWVQRLRHIRQLGFVGLVYPGAVHDRFQHSLGVMHLAGERFRRLRAGFADCSARELDHAWRVVRLAGLLHDVGHPPFSHSTEPLLPPVERLALPADWYWPGCQPRARRATHEDASLAVVQALTRQGVLDEDTGRDVAAVLAPSVRPSPRLAGCGPLLEALRFLVSGEVDSDRCDYLLRDSHYAGVTYGLYDLARLLACETVVPGPAGPELGLEVHGVHTLEGLLLARYQMFHQVYFHKTPPAFEYYLEQALAAGELSLAIAGLEDLMALRDDVLTARLHAARAAGGVWSRRILDRIPAKRVLRERVGREQPENFLAQALIEALREAGCHVFTRHAQQSFTRLAGAGACAEGVRLLCARRVLGRLIVEPVTAHSDLLAAFNQPIDIRHTYVLREDAERAAQVMQRLSVW